MTAQRTRSPTALFDLFHFATSDLHQRHVRHVPRLERREIDLEPIRVEPHRHVELEACRDRCVVAGTCPG